MKKICVITGTRAEYGLLRWVMEGIKLSNILDLQIITTGMHLSSKFGFTYTEIEKDGFKIDKKVEMLLSSDTDTGIAKSTGLGIVSISDALDDLKPDLVLILGDRFEIFSAATAAMIKKIPIAHLHGGEATEGLIDEPIRHSITKMSHLHFVSTEEYKKRVIQLGEQPKNVFSVGGFGIDSINKIKLLTKKELEKSIDFNFGTRNLLVTFHPVTLERGTSKNQMKELLRSLNALKNTKIIFTMPNADTDSAILFQLIEEYVNSNSNSKVFTSLGQLNYLSCLKYVDGVVGNSSSGLLEVPSFKKGTINIGDRQRGRIKAKSIIDCEPKHKSISKAINTLYSKEFKDTLNNIISPYGNGGASKKVITILEKLSYQNLLKKRFYDLV